MIVITEINIYPVKSLAGISVQTWKLAARGLEDDRRWMVVTPEGDFMSQRTHPQMALITPRFENGRLLLSMPGLQDHAVPEQPSTSSRMRVRIWDDDVDAVPVGEESDAWLTAAIGTPCHLVRFPDDGVRQCDLTYVNEGDQTGFADGFPLLLISEGSLEDLNNRLDEPLPMRRFRPNLVVSGCEPYAEDGWKQIQIGSVPARAVKPCSRCVITTVDPATGVKSGVEPLKTLATYRKRGNKVYFGINVVHDETGSVATGDELIVVD